MSEKIVKFDGFTLDYGRYQLLSDDTAIRMEGRPMQVLMLLVERAGELVSREEIADYLWGKDVFVDVEQSINTAVRKVRIALGDDSDSPRYLQTVVGRGYRFIGRPTVEEDGDMSHVKMFTAEELGQAVLSAAGLSPENLASTPKEPRDS